MQAKDVLGGLAKLNAPGPSFLLPAALLLAFVLGCAAASSAQDKTEQPAAPKIDGRWTAEIAGKTYTLDLRLEDGDLLGTVRLPNNKTAEVTDGICVTDEFSFTTVEDGVEWEWTGTFNEAELKGERLRLDAEQTQSFTAKRSGS
jgi:hypothetical protein